MREAHEEAGIDVAAVTVRAERVTSGLAGGWTYTTVVADATETLVTSLNQESTELRWVPEPEVEAMALHSGFAEAWPSLRTSPVRMLLDTANVLGASGPTGWWRDRPGATERPGSPTSPRSCPARSNFPTGRSVGSPASKRSSKGMPATRRSTTSGSRCTARTQRRRRTGPAGLHRDGRGGSGGDGRGHRGSRPARAVARRTIAMSLAVLGWL